MNEGNAPNIHDLIQCNSRGVIKVSCNNKGECMLAFWNTDFPEKGIEPAPKRILSIWLSNSILVGNLLTYLDVESDINVKMLAHLVTRDAPEEDDEVKIKTPKQRFTPNNYTSIFMKDTKSRRSSPESALYL